jgi:hypothetical protein
MKKTRSEKSRDTAPLSSNTLSSKGFSVFFSRFVRICLQSFEKIPHKKLLAKT